MRRDMAKNKKFKWDLKKILIALLVVAVVIGVATGKISLASLLGLEADTPAVTLSGEAATKATLSTDALVVKPSESKETIDLSKIETVDLSVIDLSTVDIPPYTAAPGEQSLPEIEKKEYYFRYKSYLTEHYEKHGIEMGFPDANAYRKAASDIINSAGERGVLYKYKSDGSNDICFYVEATKEFVVLSNDGYIRTYFICSGRKYYDRQ